MKSDLKYSLIFLLLILSSYVYAGKIKITINNNCKTHSLDINRTSLGEVFTCESLPDLDRNSGPRDFNVTAGCTYSISPIAAPGGISATFNEPYTYVYCYDNNSICGCHQQTRP